MPIGYVKLRFMLIQSTIKKRNEPAMHQKERLSHYLPVMSLLANDLWRKCVYDGDRRHWVNMKDRAMAQMATV